MAEDQAPEAKPERHAIYDETLLRFVGNGTYVSDADAKDALAEYRKGDGKGHKLELRSV